MADALLILMDKKTYAAITIGEITEKAGVNRSTFYRNFASKDEIIQHYFNRIIFTHMAGIPQEPVSIPDYLRDMFAHYYGYKKELLLLYRAGMAHIMLDTLNETFSAVRAGDSAESRYATYYHTGGIYNSFLLWFKGGMAESPAEMASITLSCFPPGLRPHLWPG